MGLDDSREVVVVTGVGISLGGRRYVVRVAGEGEKLLGVRSDGAVFLFLNERAEEKTKRVSRSIRFVDALIFGDRIGAFGPGDFGTEARHPF